MLKTQKNYQFDTLPTTQSSPDYKISANDILGFHIFFNDGYKLIELSTLDNGSRDAYDGNNLIEYLVETDGMVKLPVLGRVSIAGLTVKEAEQMLESRYNETYIKSFVKLRVVNKRVIVFPGSGGDAKVIPLNNDNTTLIEALASAGGITDRGKAYRVKLIRKNGNKNDVFLIDLSKIEGVKSGNTILQANDIIYVEPRLQIAKEVIAEIAPVLSILTSLIVITTYLKNQ
jgi:polysaccharide export outer membrane protein